MEKENAIGKINKVGRIGTVIMTILKVLLIIGMVITVVGSVVLYILPNEKLWKSVTGNGEAYLPLDNIIFRFFHKAITS